MRPRSMLVGAVAATVLVFVGGTLASEEPPAPGCEVAAELQDELDELDATNWDDCTPDQPCWEERIRRAIELREEHPAEYSVHKAYVQLVQRREPPSVRTKELTEEYSEYGH